MLQNYLQDLLLSAPPILLALTVHECAHAWVAERFGDPTARMLGRVTLNPLKHLDPIGTIALFLSGMFGWAKPVPINPRNFRNINKAITWVSLAGPISNLVLAAISAIVFHLFVYVGPAFATSMPSVYMPVFIMVKFSIIVNVSLAIFNMLPIPPLDGSKVLYNVLPADKAFALMRLEQYGFVILMVLIMTGMVDWFVAPLRGLMLGFLIGGI